METVQPKIHKESAKVTAKNKQEEDLQGFFLMTMKLQEYRQNLNLILLPTPYNYHPIAKSFCIILYNIQGVIVLKSAEIHISIAHLPRGVYGYRLVSRTGIHTSTGKIILE